MPANMYEQPEPRFLRDSFHVRMIRGGALAPQPLGQFEILREALEAADRAARPLNLPTKILDFRQHIEDYVKDGDAIVVETVRVLNMRERVFA